MMPLRGTGAPTVPTIVECDPVAIGLACDIRNPFLIFEIPSDRLAQTALEGLRRLPAQLVCDLACIDGIAPVVSGPVLHERDLLAIGLAVAARLAFVKEIAEAMQHLEVCPLVRGADIVCFAGPAPFQHAAERRAVVADIKPVANVLAVAIDRQ